MQVSDLPPENFYIKDVFSHFFTDLPKVNHLILNSAIIDLYGSGWEQKAH